MVATFLSLTFILQVSFLTEEEPKRAHSVLLTVSVASNPFLVAGFREKLLARHSGCSALPWLCSSTSEAALRGQQEEQPLRTPTHIHVRQHVHAAHQRHARLARTQRERDHQPQAQLPACRRRLAAPPAQQRAVFCWRHARVGVCAVASADGQCAVCA